MPHRCRNHGAMLFVIHIQTHLPDVVIISLNAHNMKTMTGTNPGNDIKDISYSMWQTSYLKLKHTHSLLSSIEYSRTYLVTKILRSDSACSFTGSLNFDPG